ncbi:5-hydroxytryptamine receptor 1A-like [Saccostrea echinata]|uniref:5-hydroxytryptamine receptor 1A-like n=1 Tax=Saccostrea echinata TaxID=191078 RepID=UPI002A805A48|nr:5-hydroxytryptamine receptor 1A-like [Saccostrea echinata]
MNNIGPDFVSRTISIFIAIFAVIIIIATVFGNSLVILSILTDRRLHRVGNIFIVSLALSDVLVGICVTPFALIYQLQGTWNFGPVFCEFWVSMDIICCTASILNLCMISYDRYNAIAQPLHYAQFRTVRRVLFLVTIAWVYSIVIALPPLLGWKTPDPKSPESCAISQNVGYTLYSTIGAFYLPLIVMLCFYCKIFQVTWLRGKQWVRGPGNSLIIKSMNRFQKRRKCYSYKTCGLYCNKGEEGEGKNKPIGNTENENQGQPNETSTEMKQEVPVTDNNQTLDQPKIKPRRPILVRQISFLSSTDSGYTTTSGEASISSDTTTTKDYPERMPSIAEDEIITEVVDKETGKLISQCRGGQTIKNGDDLNFPKTSLTTGNSGENQVKNVLKRRHLKRRDTISLPQERRAVRTLGIVVGCFLICWLPFFIVALLVPLCPEGVFPEFVQSLVLFLGYFNSACNPVIYTFFNKEFRAAFKKILCCKFRIPSPTYL